jgi:altronate hydrolase
MTPSHHEVVRNPDLESYKLLPESERATFQGYRRATGRAGTRNYIGILTSVNCSASVARFIAQEVTQSGILADYPNVDGVVPFVHGTGCGMAGQG